MVCRIYKDQDLVHYRSESGGWFVDLGMAHRLSEDDAKKQAQDLQYPQTITTAKPLDILERKVRKVIYVNDL